MSKFTKVQRRASMAELFDRAMLAPTRGFDPQPVISPVSKSTPQSSEQGHQTSPLHYDFSQISVQPKLEVSQPDDSYEQEADHVTDQVMEMQEPRTSERQLVMRSLQQTVQRQSTSHDFMESGFGHDSSRIPIQPKLTISQPNDPYEQEADRVAAEVVNQIQTPSPSSIQREGNLEEEEIQTKPLAGSITPLVQREEDLEEDLEEEEDLLMMPVQRVAGGEGKAASPDLETSIAQARGGGQTLDQTIREPIEQAMGADFSRVKVHTDAQADQLNRSVQAKAFTTGQDVFFRQGEYNPGSRGGQELIAHELTHVVQQNGGAVQRSVTQNSLPIQRVFEPATVTTNAHLRTSTGTGVNTGTKTGRKILPGTQIVVDPAQQDTEKRKFRSDETWIRAVDVRPEEWNPSVHTFAGGYIRQSSTQPTQYRESVPLDIPSRGTLNCQKRWHEDIGYYIEVEPSLAAPGNKIVKVGNDFRTLKPGNVLAALNPLEETQVNEVSRESAVEARLEIILRDAAQGRVDPNLLATAANIEKLKHPLRLNSAGNKQETMDRWYEWSQRVFERIREGAIHLAESLVHWKRQLYPSDPTQCNITEIKLEGSDLHDTGLGAVFVTFTKPPGGTGLTQFQNETNFKVVIKPEERAIEKSLFGDENTSLASQINQQVGLNQNSEIQKIKMETHANYGSIIEFIQGQQARAINNNGVATDAMSEAIAFAFMAGLSDVHQDNVIWNNGKPYFIDADNALIAEKLQNPTSQTGFSQFNQQRTDEDIDHLKNDPAASRSQIIQALLANSTPLIEAVRNAYQGKRGRIVPLHTQTWANSLKGFINMDESNRTGLVNFMAGRLPDARNSSRGEPGLLGEVGEAGGNKYETDVEAQQIKADYEQGKIPFFHYDYDTGRVIHNGVVIWHGQTLDDAMRILYNKFPAPPSL